MISMCNMCFKTKKIATTTTFTVEYKNCIIVIKNVPCQECPLCGEVTFTDEVSRKLEKIVTRAKEILQEIAVIDFTKAA